MNEIKILGPGCPKCKQLYERTEAVVKELGLDFSVEKVTDIMQIVSYDVMMTPAIVVNGEVKSVGKVPSVDDLKAMLTSG